MTKNINISKLYTFHACKRAVMSACLWKYAPRSRTDAEHFHEGKAGERLPCFWQYGFTAQFNISKVIISYDDVCFSVFIPQLVKKKHAGSSNIAAGANIANGQEALKSLKDKLRCNSTRVPIMFYTA